MPVRAPLGKGLADAPIGRPRQFSTDEVLEKAMRVFWQRGYEATSLEDLQSRTGLSRSSLYNAFGSKRALFEQAMDRYGRRRVAGLLASLENGHQGLEDVHAFFHGLARALSAAKATRGCFMVNTVIEFGGMDRVVERKAGVYFAGVERALSGALRRAADLGEIAACSIDDRARLLVTIAMGINVQARAGGSARQLARIARVARQQTDTWRLPPRKVRRARRGPDVPV